MAQQFKTQNSKFKIQNSELRHGAIIQNSKLKKDRPEWKRGHTLVG